MNEGNISMNKTVYISPGTNEYWNIRGKAFSLIKVISQNISGLSVEQEGPYWEALQAARQNETVAEILRAQSREVLLTPTLGPIPEPQRISDEEQVAAQFGLELPIDLNALHKEANAAEDWEMVCYLDQLNQGPSEFDPWTERIMTAEGIVRIVTESWDDEESSFYRRETYLNGKLHDYERKPAVRESSQHRIPSEGHLDKDYEVSYRFGEQVEYISHDDDVVAGWSEAQRYGFGAADYDKHIPHSGVEQGESAAAPAQ
jgi:hypothetical protein